MGFKLSESSETILRTVDKRLQKLMKDVLKISPIDFGFPSSGGFRTAEEQNNLFKQNTTDKKVTNCDGYKIKSRHQTKLAIDIYAYINGKASWSKNHLSIIAGLVLGLANKRGLNIRWGGTFSSNDFNGWDMPHFEIVEEKDEDKTIEDEIIETKVVEDEVVEENKCKNKCKNKYKKKYKDKYKISMKMQTVM